MPKSKQNIKRRLARKARDKKLRQEVFERTARLESDKFFLTKQVQYLKEKLESNSEEE